MIRLLTICIALLALSHVAQARIVMATVTSGHVDNYVNAQADYGLVPGDTLGIPSTCTAYISLNHIVGALGDSITIMNIGKVNINGGSIFIANFQYVRWIGRDPTDGYGFQVSNCGFRSFNTDSIFSNNRIHGIKFYHNTDYVMFTTQNRSWTGNIADANHDNIFDSIGVQKSDGGWWFGNPSDGVGFWVRTECYNFKVDSLNESTFWHANDFFAGNIHDNDLHELALGDTTDAGVLDIHGSAYFWNNYIHQYQGSIVRAHMNTLVSSKAQPGDTTIIFNNVAKNAAKYGGVQVNCLASDTGFSYIRPGSIIVCFNSFSKFLDRSYWIGPPAGGGGVPCDHYWCFGPTDKFIYNAYDSMHYDHGQNLAVNYLVHDGTGQPYPDTTGNIWVHNPRVTYMDTARNIPFKSCELTSKAIGQPFASVALNGLGRTLGKPAFVGAYNYYLNIDWILKNKHTLKS